MMPKRAERGGGSGHSTGSPLQGRAGAHEAPRRKQKQGRRAASAVNKATSPNDTVTYAIVDSPIGRLLVAATERGISWVDVGDSDDELIKGLRFRHQRGNIIRGGRAIPFAEAVKGLFDGYETPLPLDIRGTDFQLDVWRTIQRIPRGETRSYSEVARLVGRPSAVRAVANACASNPVPFIIPCHRVIRKDGEPGGYGFGIQRKEWLIEHEQKLVHRN